MLKRDLQTIHEYEADNAVLHSGISIESYQLLLIKKAVGKRLYTVANSLNQSNLRKRITMMLSEKSSARRMWKLLYIVPLTCFALTAFAEQKTVFAESVATESKNDNISIYGKKGSEEQHKETVARQTQQAEEQDATKTISEQPAENGISRKENISVIGKRSATKQDERTSQSEETLKIVSANDNGLENVNFYINGKKADNSEFSALNTHDIEQIEVDKTENTIHVTLKENQSGKSEKKDDIIVIGYGKTPEKVEKTSMAGKTENTQRVIEYGQTTVSENTRQTNDSDTPFLTADEMPAFNGKGSLDEFRYWVMKEISFPAETGNISGRVTVGFVVEKNGKVGRIKVLESSSELLSKEVVRVIGNSPKWTPGKNAGKKVAVNFTLSIIFETK